MASAHLYVVMLKSGITSFLPFHSSKNYLQIDFAEYLLKIFATSQFIAVFLSLWKMLGWYPQTRQKCFLLQFHNLSLRVTLIIDAT
jgi:hypothetical protein